MMRHTISISPSIVLLVAVVTACSDSGGGPVADQQALSSPGPHAVTIREMVFVDRSRPTAPNQSFPGAPERTLQTRIWHPTSLADGPFPIIAYAHGYISSRFEAEPLKNHLASHGYIVVAPDFPLSNGAAPGGPTIADMANQPGDLSFVLREMRSLGGEDAALAAAIDTTRQGIAGLSLGGGTVLIAAYHPVLHMPEIKAAVAHAPLACLFGEDFYARAIPTLIVGGDADMLVPFDQSAAKALELAPPPLTVVKLIGGYHVGFIGIDVPGAINSDESVGCRAVETVGGPGSSAAAFARLVSELTSGTTGTVVDATGCGMGEICPVTYVQTMTSTRQTELARAATLAHFEAELRGREDAARFLERAIDGNNSDVEVSLSR